MLKSVEIRPQVAQRLRELLPTAKAWEETADTKISGQRVDLVAKFRLIDQEHTLVVEISPLGQPRQIRAVVTRLAEIRRDLPEAYPVAAAVYIGPQSARILTSHNLGYVDLSGNCYLAFGNVLIEKEGKRNVRPSVRPLRSLFAPRATRVIRVLLVEPARAWRLEELARAAAGSLGHAHNVVTGPEPPGTGRALLPRGRPGPGRRGARPPRDGRGGRRRALSRALRPRRVLRRAGEGRAQGAMSAAALRRPPASRAAWARAGRTSPARGHGLLSAEPRARACCGESRTGRR